MNPTRFARTILIALAALPLASPVAAQAPSPRRVAAQHTVVELIVDRQPDATTRELWAGLRFELEQDWHIYWQNPGDSGGPPYILWQPAAGLTPGEFEWPLPERIPLGPIMNYGYTNEVVLPFPIKIARASGTPLEAQVKWLICKDICIPGQARLALTLPVPDADKGRVANWRQQIEESRRRVPPAAPATWRATATSSASEFVVTVRMDKPASGAAFFPLETSQVDDAAPQNVAASGNELVLRLKKSESLKGDPKVLRGVLALKSGPAYVVEATFGGAAVKPAR